MRHGSKWIGEYESLIVDDKRRHVTACKERCSQAECEKRAKAVEPPRGFAKALKAAIAAGRYGLIANIASFTPTAQTENRRITDDGPNQLSKTWRRLPGFIRPATSRQTLQVAL